MLTANGPRSALFEVSMRKARGLKRRFLGLFRRAVRPHYFDLHDWKSLNSFLIERNCRPLTQDPREAETDTAGAMRYILGTLASHRRLRKKHPRALSEGLHGSFAQSLLSERTLSDRARDRIREAFALEPALRVRRVFEFREDLRAICPLGLTPKDRGHYLSWLITHGLKDFQHSPEAAIWFHFELDEDPSRGLTATYRMFPEWQAAVPHGLTRFGWDRLKSWVKERYQFDADWLRKARLTEPMGCWDELQCLAIAEPEVRMLLEGRPDEIVQNVRNDKRIASMTDASWFDRLQAEFREGTPTEPAVNVIGLFRYTSGLQQAVKSTVLSLNRNRVRTALRDFPVLFLREPRDRQPYDALETNPITIINTGIDLPVTEAYRKSGLHLRPDVYRIAIWWWELEQLPQRWMGRDADVDEIWAPTEFIAEAMRRAFVKPVYTMLPGIELPRFAKLGKSYFGIDPNRFTFGFIFDMNSRMQRKNPLGLIRAFRNAFREGEPVELIIKVSPPESYYQDQWALLLEEIAKTRNVRLIDRVLTREELLALVDAFDCGVSLHRSEGFGLTCAESMLLGKPVIATGYSGNRDFMTSENSYLVKYQPTTISEDIDPYPKGATWAEPDLDHAATLLRRVFEHPDEARAVGLRAQSDLSRILSIDAAGARMRERLIAISRLRCR